MFRQLHEYLYGKVYRFIDKNVHGVISDVTYQYAKKLAANFTATYIFSDEIQSTAKRDKCYIFEKNECWSKLNGIKECFEETVKLEEVVTIEPSIIHKERNFDGINTLAFVSLATFAANGALCVYALLKAKAAALQAAAAPIPAPVAQLPVAAPAALAIPLIPRARKYPR
jgi:hypothetical protein